MANRPACHASSYISNAVVIISGSGGSIFDVYSTTQLNIGLCSFFSVALVTGINLRPSSTSLVRPSIVLMNLFSDLTVGV